MKYDKDFEQHIGLKKTKRFSTVVKDNRQKMNFKVKNKSEYIIPIEHEYREKKKKKIFDDIAVKEYDPDKKPAVETAFRALFDWFGSFLGACVGAENKDDEKALSV